MRIYEIKFQYYHKIRNDYLIIQLAFATNCYVNYELHMTNSELGVKFTCQLFIGW
jgi:hypothetical protein